jgi:hypothetical protein
MKRARPLQESSRGAQNGQRTAAVTAGAKDAVKNDVKAAFRTTFGSRVVAKAAGLQKEKENEGRPAAAMTRSRLQSRERLGQRERSLKAGSERVGPDTPIGKLSARIKRMKHEKEGDTTVAGAAWAGAAGGRESQAGVADVDAALDSGICKAKALCSGKGIAAARKYMEAFPTAVGMGVCRTKLAYWVACIDLERTAKEWDRVAEFFERARVNIACASELRSLQALLEDFEKESDELYEEERQRLDQR